ncbi:MAG: radical SAM protein [Clostridia bacterium]|nr:radical SAM protein [Clostridia bacterium]
MLNDYLCCTLCQRRCRINRHEAKGYCKSTASLSVARAALHLWEEPIISGTRGSGTIFFSGCSLGCIYCQNHEISGAQLGRELTPKALADVMLRLEERGAHNVNLVTPTHFAPSVREAILIAKSNGLSLPIVYNTGSYDSQEALSLMSGLVDVYLPDLKYYRSETARELSYAEDYPSVAREAIAEMHRQTGAPVIGEDGLIRRGTVVRILLLPGHVAEAKLSLKYLYEAYGNEIFVSLMSQYTPIGKMPPPLNRRVTREEYRQLTDYAARLGVENCFIQDISSSSEAFIPDFKSLEIPL